MPDGKLSDQDKQFCEGVATFCAEHRITVRRLSEMCDGHVNKFMGTTVHRFLHADVEPSTVERMRPIIAPAFVRFLDDRGYHASDVETELSPIFDIKEFKSMLFNRCELAPAVVRFFGLRLDPFDVDHIPADDEIFTNQELDDTVQRVKDAILYHRFVAVIGDVGSGKTLLKMRVAAELSCSPPFKGGVAAALGGRGGAGGSTSANGRVKTQLLYPEFYDMEQVEVGAIASFILRDFDQKVPQSKPDRVRKIKHLLTDLYNDDIRTALILDECHRLNNRVISSLKNFWEMTNGKFNRLLGVVLYGQPAFVQSRLREVTFKEIRQRVQIIEMPSLRGASRDYVAHRIKLAGGDVDELFEKAALDAICRNATTPLALGNLINEALLEAYELEEKRVSQSFNFFKKLRDAPQVLNMRKAS